MQPCPSRCAAFRLVGQALRALRVRIRVGYVGRPGPRRARRHTIPAPLQGASRVCTRAIVAQAHGMPCETPATPPRGLLRTARAALLVPVLAALAPIRPQGAPCCVVCLQNKNPGRSAVATERRGFSLAAKEGRLPFVYPPINCTAWAGVTMRMPLWFRPGHANPCRRRRSDRRALRPRRQ